MIRPRTAELERRGAAMGDLWGGGRKENLAVYEKNSGRPCGGDHGRGEFVADKKRDQIQKNFIFFGFFSDPNKYQ